MKTKNLPLCPILLIVLCLAATPALAQNLLDNPDFDSGISDWNPEELRWIAEDGGGTSGPGCAEIFSDFNNGGVANSASSRVPVSENTEYYVSGWTKLDTTSLADGASIFVRWFDSDGIIQGISTFIDLPFDDWDGQWHEVNGTVTSFQGSAEADVHIGVQTPSDGVGESRVRWDSIYFGLQPLPPLIYLDGFEDIAGGN